MSDDCSDQLWVGLALGFAAALALVALVWRLRATDAAQDLSERQFPVEYDLDPEAIGVAEEGGGEADGDLDDLDLDDEELGL